jgi:DNA-binding transcriptional LysR family regulator
VAEAAVQARGDVKIIANESVSTYVLPKVLRHLRACWPKTQFSVSVATCADVRCSIEDGRFDVGVIIQPAADSRVGSETRIHHRDDGYDILAPFVPLVMFADPAHPLAIGEHRRPAARNELSGLLVFTSDSSGEFHDLISNFFLEDGLPTARLQSAGSVEGVKRCVTSDRGALGILPTYAIEEELRDGRVVTVDIRPTPPAMQLVALLPRVEKCHPSVIQLTDSLRNVFRSSV